MNLNFYKSKETNYSSLQNLRKQYKPTLPEIFNNIENLCVKYHNLDIQESILKLFPTLSLNTPKYVEILKKEKLNSFSFCNPLRVGVVLSGGQAPGGHNVISGLFDFIKKVHLSSQLFGFLGGPNGIYSGKYIEITEEIIDCYRNQGGFDIICSGRHKIETPEQFENSLKHCSVLDLNGLVVIGGDDSNTNACLLAEYFIKNKSKTVVIGAPKTIDGDLKNEHIEVSFGFDTATKVYSEQIGNICLDTLSSKKYYHFIKLMGRSASHISLECALNTQVNLVLIGEEVEKKNQTLADVTKDILNMIIKRSKINKNYGVILIPEGLIEFIPEISILIKEINDILSKESSYNKSTNELRVILNDCLTEESKKVFNYLPKLISDQLLLDRDPHGNVQVSRIETEKLLILSVQKEIELYNKSNKEIKFLPQAHFFGYEGRCALPSNFDSNYCYSLGFNAGFLITQNMSGYMSIIKNLKDERSSNWIPAGCPLITMMNVEKRKGKLVPVIKKALVDLDSNMMKAYNHIKEQLMYNDCYKSIGPLQLNNELNNEIESIPYLVHTPELKSIKLNDLNIEEEKEKTPYAPKKYENLPSLCRTLISKPLKLPLCLRHKNPDIRESDNILEKPNNEVLKTIKKDLEYLYSNQKISNLLEVITNDNNNVISNSNSKDLMLNLKIGIVYNGRQAPGGNNIVKGMLEFKKKFKELNSSNEIELIGFKNGTLGFFESNYIDITEDNFKLYNNLGGYDYLGRSIDRIRSEEELDKAVAVCDKLKLDGLILVGASHTLSDAALLTNYIIKKNKLLNTKLTNIVAVPCTVDNNVNHLMFEATIGFDTASKMYSQLIGNIMTDAASNTKYWYFIRLMGRNPSHVVLESSLQTRPNYTIISEEIAKNKLNLNNIVDEICDIIIQRANDNKNYGIVIIPEGLLSYLTYFQMLIEELNKIIKYNKSLDIDKMLGCSEEDIKYIRANLSSWNAAYFIDLPLFFKKQLLLYERESSGNIQLSQLETEKLIAYLVSNELQNRKKKNNLLKFNFSYLTYFLGYQGRCSHPTMFDATLAASYGFTACIIIKNKRYNGYCVTAKGLSSPCEEWILGGIPLSSMISLDYSSTYGYNKCHIKSNDVSLKSKAFQKLKIIRNDCVINDSFRNPGPIQYNEDYYDSIESYDKVPISVYSNFLDYKKIISDIKDYCDKIKTRSRFGINENILKATLLSLENLDKLIKIIKDQ